MTDILDDFLERIQYDTARDALGSLGVQLADEVLKGVLTPKTRRLAECVKDMERIRDRAHRELIVRVAG